MEATIGLVEGLGHDNRGDVHYHDVPARHQSLPPVRLGIQYNSAL